MRAWGAVKTATAWIRFHVFMVGREIPTQWSISYLRSLRVFAGVMGGLVAAIGFIAWYNWGIARARALGILVDRQQVSAYLAMKSYARGREQVRYLMDKVDADPSISDAEKIQRKGNLASTMLALLAGEDASMKVYQAAARAKASIPHRVSGSTRILDPITGTEFSLEEDPETAKRPLVAEIQNGDQAKEFLRLVAFYGRPGADAMPTGLGSLLDPQPTPQAQGPASTAQGGAQ